MIRVQNVVLRHALVMLMAWTLTLLTACGGGGEFCARRA